MLLNYKHIVGFSPAFELIRKEINFAGPRNCIGFKYGMMSMKTAIAHTIRNLKFSTKLKLEELRFEIDVTLKLVNQHLVTVEIRHE
uniref:Uncharacterized protein n=1 Tax=Phlebotomus papatasi TaxID=29031 RepID=A0A1B0DA01_PHLPP